MNDRCNSPESGTRQDTPLRQEAEKTLRTRTALSQEEQLPEETRKILHELRVHQIELEMQNEELRNIQLELIASKERYFDLYNLAPVGYVTVSEKGLILDANLTIASMIGVARSGLINQPFSRYILPDDQDSYYLYRKQLFEVGSNDPFDLRMVKKDGTVFWSHLTAVAVLDTDGAPLVRLTMSDITARKKADEAIMASEARFRTIIDISPVPMALNDEQQHITFLNPAFVRTFGYTVEDIPTLDHWWLQAYPDPGYRQWVADTWQAGIDQAKRTGTAFPPMEVSVRCKNGKIKTVLVSATSLTNTIEDTHLVVLFDISDRKCMEESLRKSEERLSLALMATKDAVWDWDLLANTIYYSPNWWKMVGYAENEREVDFNLWRGLMHPEDVKRADSIVNEAIASGTSFEVECRLLHKKGHYVPVLTRGFIQRNDAGNPERISGTNTDLTERKQIEENNRQWEQMQHQLQKVASLNRMAGAIAHHFNNQLQVVMGNMELALDNLPKNGDTSEILSEALSEAMTASRKAAGISSMLLTYRGQLSDKIEPIDLSEACRQSFTVIQAAAPKGIILRASFPGSGPVIAGNESMIYQILTNLLSNAWEASTETQESQGVIDLIVQTVSHKDIPAQKRFPIGWQPKECTYACLEVADAGSGIADHDIEKLFDPFFTTKLFGRGMGLSVVLGIVETQGGGITVESRPGLGSIFRVYLPVVATNLPIRSVTAEKSPEIQQSGTILLIDDDQQVRKMAKIMLTRLGYQVIEAQDGVEALELFQQHKDEIRGVLSDLTMPRMNGWKTLAALRKLSPDIPVILSSGYDEAQVMTNDYAVRPNAFLGKPYQLKKLRETINRVLG